MLFARIAIPTALFFGILTSAYAQFDTGTVLGMVRDDSGAVIPGANVTIRDEGTSLTQTQTTSASGEYVFTPLKIGRYSVEVEHSGFKKERRTGLVLNIQQQAVVDFTLSVGDVTNEIEVTAAAPFAHRQIIDAAD